MATIDKLDIGVYIQYARFIDDVQRTNQLYHLEQASSIPPQLMMIDMFPKMSELDLLLGVVPVLTPWAYFFPPKKYRDQRKSPFTFSRIIPSLDEDEEDAQRLMSTITCDTLEEKREKEVILAFFKQREKINDWLKFIIGRMGQFLQG